MAIDMLQDKIRKTKNPSVVDFTLTSAMIPSHILEAESDTVRAMDLYGREMLDTLKETVPAVRFGFGSYAMLGAEGLTCMASLLQYAAQLGYYVLLDLPEMFSSLAAKNAAQLLADWPCDGVVVSAYLGTDILKPFLECCKRDNKDVFVVLRTSNKSAPELQDLLTGSRLVHTAAADIVSRQGEPLMGKFGYSQVAAVAAASSADSLRNLRGKYKRLFLLLDGYDYPNANAKNCSYAFDKLGRGAAACAGSSILAAWQEKENGEAEYTALAVQAAERMKKNLTRYITVL